jgi:hypothetical protein
LKYSVLAIDASMTCSGFAHYSKGNEKPTWGLFEQPPWSDSEGKYLWEFFEWLGNLCVDKKVTHLFIEDVRFKHKHAETLTQMIASIGLIGQAAIVAYKLTERGQHIEFQAVSPIDWRRLFLGVMHKPSGILPQQWRVLLKEAAVAECAKRGWIVSKDDESDALGIMTFGICTIDESFRNFNTPLFNRAEVAFDKSLMELK